MQVQRHTRVILDELVADSRREFIVEFLSQVAEQASRFPRFEVSSSRRSKEKLERTEAKTEPEFEFCILVSTQLRCPLCSTLTYDIGVHQSSFPACKPRDSTTTLTVKQLSPTALLIPLWFTFTSQGSFSTSPEELASCTGTKRQFTGKFCRFLLLQRQQQEQPKHHNEQDTEGEEGDTENVSGFSPNLSVTPRHVHYLGETKSKGNMKIERSSPPGAEPKWSWLEKDELSKLFSTLSLHLQWSIGGEERQREIEKDSASSVAASLQLELRYEVIHLPTVTQYFQEKAYQARSTMLQVLLHRALQHGPFFRQVSLFHQNFTLNLNNVVYIDKAVNAFRPQTLPQHHLLLVQTLHFDKLTHKWVHDPRCDGWWFSRFVFSVSPSKRIRGMVTGQSEVELETKTKQSKPKGRKSSEGATDSSLSRMFSRDKRLFVFHSVRTAPELVLEELSLGLKLSPRDVASLVETGVARQVEYLVGTKHADAKEQHKGVKGGVKESQSQAVVQQDSTSSPGLVQRQEQNFLIPLHLLFECYAEERARRQRARCFGLCHALGKSQPENVFLVVMCVLCGIVWLMLTFLEQ